MSDTNFYDSIPHGPNDKPVLLCDPLQPIVFEPNDIDGPFFMLDRDFGGCIVLPFSKPMSEGEGCVSANGKEIPFVLKKLYLGGGSWWLGVRLRGRLRGYDERLGLQISGFRDKDGNEMLPVSLEIRTPERVKPQSRYIMHEKVALQAAEEGIVLLKNEHLLPLPRDAALNVFGKGMHEFRTSAVGAGKSNPRYTMDFLSAAKKSGFSLNEELVEYYTCGEDILPSEAILKRAKLFSSVAVMLISRPAGENFDASSDEGEFYPSRDEIALLDTLCDSFSHVLVILNVGYPIGTRFLERNGVEAVVYCGFGGMLGGLALVNVLNGTVNPSGKLPDTWACRYSDIPSSVNFYDCEGGKPRIGANNGDVWVDTVYEEGIYVGYRYFSTFGKNVAYPFGFGLSYTEFSIKTRSCRYDGKALHLSVEVVNIGKEAGKEVIQVYLRKPEGVLEKPARELIAFKKTRLLLPQEMQTFTIVVPDSDMVSYDETSAAYIMEKGKYAVSVGNSSVHASKAGFFTLAQTKIVKQVKNRMQPPVAITELSQRDENATWPKGMQSGIREGAHGLGVTRKPGDYPCRAKEDDEKLKRFVDSLSVKELARLAVCAKDSWGMQGIGEAGSLASLPGRDLPKFTVADGNSGVNVNVKNIGMPSGATLCASFNKQLIEQVGRVIGEEAKELGIDLILAPAFNIHRNPLCGRQPEYFSEDPLLAGKMAGCYCRGLESTGVGGCYKHLIANNAETSRKRNHSIISERALREIYFAAFRYAFEEHMPRSIMTAYNAVNGVFAAEDTDLIQGLVREECGFDGFVMTDWESYDTADVAKIEAAGNTWLTPGSLDDTYTEKIKTAVENGELSVARLRENIYYLLAVVFVLKGGKGDEKTSF